MTDNQPPLTKDLKSVHRVVFFCPGCRRRIVFFRMTPFCWHLDGFCDKARRHLRMRRSKNQSIDKTESQHAQ